MSSQKFSRSFLSADVNGSGFLVRNVSSIGVNEYTLLHDTTEIPPESNSASVSDITFEVWIYALNINATETIPVAIKWACLASASGSYYQLDPGSEPYDNEGSTIVIDVLPRQGPTLIIPGMIIKGDTGKIIAQIDYTNPDVVIYGYTNVIDNTFTIPPG